MIDHIDEILALCDRVFGPDDNEPVPTSLVECMPGPHRPHRPHDTYIPDEDFRLPPLRQQLDQEARIRFRAQATRRIAYPAENTRWPRGRNKGVRTNEVTFDVARRIAEQGGGTLCNNTYVAVTDKGFDVVFHSTPIFSYDASYNSATLRNGGYETVTTKQRLNSLLQAHGFHVYQDKFSWYVMDSAGYGRGFEDGMSLTFT
jgi:hypothetical protein